MLIRRFEIIEILSLAPEALSSHSIEDENTAACKTFGFSEQNLIEEAHFVEPSSLIPAAASVSIRYEILSPSIKSGVAIGLVGYPDHCAVLAVVMQPQWKFPLCLFTAPDQ